MSTNSFFQDTAHSDDLINSYTHDNGINVAFNNLTYAIPMPKSKSAHVDDNFDNDESPTKQFLYPLKNVSGVLQPGKMVLVLGPSGSGRSTFLKSVTDRLETTNLVQENKKTNQFDQTSNFSEFPRLLYNSLTPSEFNKSLFARGGSLKEESKYVSQLDKHLNYYTVEETLDFAARTAFPTKNQKKTMSSSQIDLFIKTRINQIISLLDLHHCRDTIAGDHIVRGISGGQLRRLSIGEMLITNPRLIALDNYTDGLDVVSGMKITEALKNWCVENKTTVVASLQQPNDDIFKLFDCVIVLREGECVFNGPVDDLLDYFQSQLGFSCPNDISTCDFIIDVVSDPYLTAERLEQRREILKFHQDDIDEIISQNGHLERNNQNNVVLKGNAPPKEPIFSLKQMVKIYQDSIYATRQYQLLKDSIMIHKRFIQNTPLYRYSKSSPKMHDVSSNNVTIIGPNSLNSLNSDSNLLLDQPNSKNSFNLLDPENTPSVSPQIPFPSTLGSSFWSVFTRQFKLMRRNMMLITFRLLNVIISCLILGTIFWNIPIDSPFVRVTLICIMFSQFSVYNMAGVLGSVRYSNVVKKQISAGFFPSFFYTFSLFSSGAPQLIFDCTCLIATLYFGSRFYPQISSFLPFYIIAILTALNNYSIIQVVCATTTSESLAGALAIPITAVLLLGSGMFITKSHLPIILRYLVMYPLPYFWSLRALLNVEFLSPRYDTLTPGGKRIGDLYLQQLDIDVGYDTVWECAVYMGISALVWLSLHMYVLNVKYYHDQVGTQRSNDAKLRFLSANRGTQDILPILTQYLPFTPCTLTFSNLSYSVQVRNNGKVGQNPGDDKNAPLLFDNNDANLQCSGQNGNINNKTGRWIKKPIFGNVNGFAAPGYFTALCGPSGSGKTTLLEVISQRKTSGEITGSVCCNGHELVSEHSKLANKINLASIIGFVEQHDWIYPNETVYQALKFVLDMKLPLDVGQSDQSDQNNQNNQNDQNNLSRSEIQDLIITEILSLLELTYFKDHLIGMNANGSKTAAGSGVGLSLSQIKKLSIALELVANPSILYLDEITTGLSATDAFSVLSLCAKIAKSGRTVIATVHAPSTEMFYLFDQVLLLGMGMQIYNGPVGIGAKDFIRFYQNSNLVKMLKKKQNPASWMLSCLDVGFNDDISDQNVTTSTSSLNDGLHSGDLDEKLRECIQHLTKLNQYWLNSPEFEASSRNLSNYKKQLSPLTSTGHALSEPKPIRNIFYQFFRLSYRMLSGMKHDSVLFYTRMFMFIFTSILTIFMYGALKITDMSGLVSSIQGKVMATTLAAILFSGQQLVMVDRRAFYYREVERGYYSNIFMFSFYFVEILLAITFAIIFLSPSYFVLNWSILTGLIYDEASKTYMWNLAPSKWIMPYLNYLIPTISNLIFYSSFSLAVITISGDPRLSGICQGLSALLFYYLNGVIIPVNKLASPIAHWICKHNPTRFVTEAVVMGQFKYFNKDVMIEAIIDGKSVQVKVVDYVATYLDYQYDTFWVDIKYIYCFCGVFLILAIGFNQLFWFKQR